MALWGFALSPKNELIIYYFNGLPTIHRFELFLISSSYFFSPIKKVSKKISADK
jgi:hypothetical protein